MRESRALLFAAGFVIAVIGAVCGIGGGLFAMPLLHFVRGLELKRAVATGLVLVVATTGSSTITECLRDAPELHLSIVWRVALGALFGAQLGFLAMNRIPIQTLRLVFVFVLFAAAIRVAWSDSGDATATAAVEWLDADAKWRALFAGLGGGFVAPLLGVGGGLIMVPALFLGIPGMGFTEARATSLAAGFVGSSRSLWLHARAGRVDLGAVAPLALGAVAGAAVGVQLVHLQGAADVGRYLLAAVLTFVAIRFARDAARSGRADA